MWQRSVASWSKPPESLKQSALAARAATEGRRRNVAVLFADLAGFTQMTEELGDEALFAAMQDVTRVLMGAVHDNLGVVQDFTGDGIMALFGAPVAVENAPLMACRAAIEIQRRMSALNGSRPRDEFGPWRLRIGLNAGPLIVGRIGDDLHMEFTALGDTVNLASRLEKQAEPDTVLISEAMWRQVRDFVDATDLGSRRIRGKADDVGVLRLNAVREAVTRFDVSLSRGLSPFFGRDDDLGILTAAWRASTAGVPHVVSIVGDAGMGKSRLMHEFRASISQTPHIFLRGHCTFIGQGAPFLPFVDLLRRAFHLPDTAFPDEIGAALTTGLRRLGLETDGLLPYLLNLLGLQAEAQARLDPDQTGSRTRQALRSVIEAHARDGPVVLFIEDTHWIDGASQDLLLEMAQSSADRPILIVVAHRPGSQTPWPDDGRASRILLQRLSGQFIQALIRERTGAAAVSAQMSDWISEKTDGNPLIAEELLNALIEQNRIVIAGGTAELAEGQHANELPATVEGILMQRVDRLPETERKLLEIAAVIGRRFPTELVARVADSGTRVNAIMVELEVKELILGESASNGERYRFKHALIQDAVYNSLLSATRRQLHLTVAQAFETMRPLRLAEFADVLALHYDKGGDAGKAAEFRLLAGQHSLSLYAIEDAYGQFRRVEEILNTAPDALPETARCRLSLALLQTHYYRGAFKDLIETGMRDLQLVEAAGDAALLVRYLFYLGLAYTFAANPAESRSQMARAMEVAETTDDAKTKGIAMLGQATLLTFWQSPSSRQSEDVRRACRAILDIAGEANDTWLAAMALNYLARNALLHGDPRALRGYAVQLLALSTRTNDPLPRQLALLRLSALDANSNDPDGAIAKADEAKRLAIAPLDHALADAYKGVALVSANRGEEAYQVLNPLRARAIEQENLKILMIAELSLGAAMVIRGQLSKGVRWIEAARKQFQDWGYEPGIANGHLILGKGNLRLLQGTIRPPLPVLLANLAFVLRRKPFAARNARLHLRAAAEIFRRFDAPSLLASVLMDEAVLNNLEGDAAACNACFDEAAVLAHKVDATSVIAKIAAARQSVGEGD